MSEIIRSPQSMVNYLNTAKAAGAKSIDVKIPTGEYTKKKFSTNIFGIELACTIEEQEYVTLTFNFK
jgi:hypothetical protein